MKKRKIGILGGSFDPIHNGHLAIARSAYQDYDLDEVWLIPAGHSPNKNENNMTSAITRAEMTEAAVKEIPFFKVSRVEIDSKETSYTYLTLQKLTKRFPDDEFYFIMGADSLDYFEKWYHPELICSYAHILVAVRDELDREAVMTKISEIKKLFQADIAILSTGRVKVSSSEIRNDIAADRNVSDKIPLEVAEYIRKKGLYSK